MTIELTMLALAVVLGLVQIIIAARAKSRQTGLQWTAGSRDEPMRRRTARPGALEFPGDLPAFRRPC
jgi:hypothetical protein